MLKQQDFTSNRFSSLISENTDVFLSSSPNNPIFVICDKCYWCATYLDNVKRLAEDVCPLCNAYNDDSNNTHELSLFPVLSNESGCTADVPEEVGWKQ
jgi:hypothetical protein